MYKYIKLILIKCHKKNINIFLILLFLNSLSYIQSKDYYNKKEIASICIEKIWTKTINHNLINNKLYFNVMPLLQKDTLFIADPQGLIKSININNNQINWKKKILLGKKQTNISSGITIHKDLLYISSEKGILYAINKNNGDIIWLKKLNQEILSLPVINENSLIIKTENGELYSLNKNTGQIIWQRQIYDAKQIALRISPNIILFENKIFVTSDNSEIYAIDKNNGDIIWQRQILNFKNYYKNNQFNNINQTPIISNNMLYIINNNGVLACIDPSSGNIINQSEFNSSKFLIHQNKIYLIENNDKIKALDINNTKNIIWKQNNLLYHKIQYYLIFNQYFIVADKLGYLYWIDKNNGKIIYKNFLNSYGIRYFIIFNNNNILFQNNIGTIYLYKLCNSVF